MIAGLRRFGVFWYDFVIGDDWQAAAGVVAALAITYALSTWTSVATWWVIPVAAVLLLSLSLRRAVRPPRDR